MTSAAYRRGTVLALLAAVAFGLTTPVLKGVAAGLGPFTTAALLYFGAAAVSIRVRPLGTLRRSDGVRLLAIALAGAAVAPACLAWGLQRTSAATAALLLNVEALFTVLLAAAVYREHVGRRVAVALAFMGAGGAVLVLGQSGAAVGISIGGAAVILAALLWAVDNTLTRALADRDARSVVFAKAGAGAVLSGVLAFGASEPAPEALAIAGTLACGATGYGLSLRLYIAAQRRLGAGRTGSIFAIGPFIGALAAPALGDPWPGPVVLAAAGLFAGGVYLHATERHGHRHVHDPQLHDHVHRHDDGHHDHVHDPPVVGEHSHPHEHERLEHDHPHAPDLHHQHRH